MVLANPEQPVQAHRITNAEIPIDGNASWSEGLIGLGMRWGSEPEGWCVDHPYAGLFQRELLP